MSFLAELKRRNVLRVALAYLVFGWLTLQIVSVVAPILDLPAWVARATLLLLAIGFLAALVVSWIYELTPAGLRRTAEVSHSQSIAAATGNRLDRFVLVGLSLIVAMFVADRLWPRAEQGPAGEKGPEAFSGADGAAATGALRPENGSGPFSPAGASIAVLPLVNLSGDDSQEYFSDGMSEELLNVLAKVPGLRVAARTSSFQFKGRNLDIQDIARQLNVATVLEGSVRKSGDRIRITAQLIDASNGYHLWSESYDRDLDDIFAVQDEIAGKIVGELRGRLGLAPADGARSTIARAASPEAYDAYLLGRELLLKRSASSVADGLAALQRATTLDPAYAPAWAQLASAYFLSRRASTGFGNMSIDEAEPLARAALAKAKRLDPELDDAYAVEGVIKQFFDNDLAGALAAHERALARNPGNAQALQWRADLLARFGRYKESLEQRLALAAVDPLLASNNNSIVRDLAMFGRSAEAESYARRLDNTDPAWAAFARAGMHTYAGEWGDAMSALLGEIDEQLGSWAGQQYVVRLLGMLGLSDEAQRLGADSDVALAVRGDWPGALAQFDEGGTNPVGREFWYFRRGYYLYRAGQRAEAIEQFDHTWPSVWPFGVADDSSYYTPRRLYYALALRASGREEDAQRVAAQNRDDVAAARRDGIKGPIVDLMAAELAVWDGDLDTALRLLPRGLMAEPFLSSIESDPLYAPLRGQASFMAAVAGERERRLRMREEFLRVACAAPADAPWRPLPASCATVAAESGDEA
jgi:TolB-like protein